MLQSSPIGWHAFRTCYALFSIGLLPPAHFRPRYHAPAPLSMRLELLCDFSMIGGVDVRHYDCFSRADFDGQLDVVIARSPSARAADLGLAEYVVRQPTAYGEREVRRRRCFDLGCCPDAITSGRCRAAEAQRLRFYRRLFRHAIAAGIYRRMSSEAASSISPPVRDTEARNFLMARPR